jgi:hypothetical protein
MTLSDLRAYVRDLTGIYSTDLLPDSLLTRWLNESYFEFLSAELWPWRVGAALGTLPKGDTVILLDSSYGRVIEAVVKYSNDNIEQMIPLGDTIVTDADEAGIFYYTNYQTGELILAKPLNEQVDYEVLYITELPEQGLETTGKASLIPTPNEYLLAYRASVKVLNSQADDSGRASVYAQEYERMLEDLRKELVTDNDLGPFQMGGAILRVDGRTDGRLNYRFRSS